MGPDEMYEKKSLDIPNLSGLCANDSGEYLLQITSPKLPNRSQIVEWCSDHGFQISAEDIWIRSGSVLKVKAVKGKAVFKPTFSILKALRDYNPECLFSEIGDEVSYWNSCIKSFGVIKGFSLGNANIYNQYSKEIDSIPLTSIFDVSGPQVKLAQDSSTEALIENAFKIE